MGYFSSVEAWLQTMPLSSSNSVEVERFLESYNCRRLGRGATRTVFALCEEYVLKVSRFTLNVANKNEVMRSLDLPEDAPIARVVRWDKEYRWIICERADPLSHKMLKSGSREFSSIYGFAAQWQIADLHWGNFGEINGRLVIVDYAG